MARLLFMCCVLCVKLFAEHEGEDLELSLVTLWLGCCLCAVCYVLKYLQSTKVNTLSYCLLCYGSVVVNVMLCALYYLQSTTVKTSAEHTRPKLVDVFVAVLYSLLL